MDNLRKRLEKRGWRRQDIEKAIGIIKKTKQSKKKESMFLERRMFWILLILIMTANFAIAAALMPLLIALSGFALYLIITALGLVFGMLFELVIRTIEHLERKHHLALAVLIPLTALANVFVISRISNDLALRFNLQNFHFPLIIGLVYAVSFVLPYLVCRFVLKIGYYARE